MYDIKIIGDSVLRRKASSFTKFDNNLARIANDMIETMHERDGIGLAAPQVGLSKRLIVIDTFPVDKTSTPMIFVNPEILESWGEITMEEGCLSIPGVNEQVTRPEGILLKYQDIEGIEKTEKHDGWTARVIQHEIDHLNGILFIDYLSPLKQKLATSKLSALI
jgi:peptide deformylase